MLLTPPLPLSQTVTNSRTLPPSSVTYFMDGSQVEQKSRDEQKEALRTRHYNTDNMGIHPVATETKCDSSAVEKALTSWTKALVLVTSNCMTCSTITTRTWGAGNITRLTVDSSVLQVTGTSKTTKTISI